MHCARSVKAFGSHSNKGEAHLEAMLQLAHWDMSLYNCGRSTGWGPHLSAVRRRQKVGKSQNTVFFPLFCGFPGSKFRPWCSPRRWQLGSIREGTHGPSNHCQTLTLFSKIMDRLGVLTFGAAVLPDRAFLDRPLAVTQQGWVQKLKPSSLNFEASRPIDRLTLAVVQSCQELTYP